MNKKEFKNYISKHIKTELKDFFNIYTDEIIPDYFFEIPASSSGKYHPKISLGNGGVVRHTVFAVDLALELFRVYNFTDIEKDIIVISLAIHDTFKSGITNEKSVMNC